MACFNKNQGACAVALGYFDGIHLGHKAVLNKALEEAKKRGLTPVVMLFDIHPRKALSGEVPPILMSDALKKEALKSMGFEIFGFDFLSAMNYSPEEFAQKVLLEQLNARVVTCGYDYRYGKNGSGTAESLRLYLEKQDAEVFSLPAVMLDGEVVSSTKIRKYISEGKIEKANAMLGGLFTYDFIVEKGDGLGHHFGFPTINQFFPDSYAKPKFGVYASGAEIDGKTYPAVTNIGIRPTVNGTEPRSETCILNFNSDLYGKKVKVSLISYLREEKKFSGIDELKKAIEKDIIKSREIFKRVNSDEKT